MLRQLFQSLSAPARSPAFATTRPLVRRHHTMTNNRNEEHSRGSEAEAALRRVKRALQVLCAGKRALLGATDEQALLREHCRAVAQAGGYRMAWIGYAGHDDARSVRPMAHWGVDDGYLDSVRASWAESAQDLSPAGTAIRTRMPVAIDDVRTDQRFASWRDTALKNGCLSCVSLPLSLDGAAFGALTLYSDQAGAACTETLTLLSETATDLALGVAAVRGRAGHARAVRTLQEREARLLAVLSRAEHAARAGSWHFSVSSRTFCASDGMRTLLGAPAAQAPYALQEILGLFRPRDWRRVARSLRASAREKRSLREEHRVLHRDGQERVLLFQGEPALDETGNVVTIYGFAQDITERRQYESNVEALLRKGGVSVPRA
ncbi:MAG TPA: GAF domain-containing protein [Burkholderiales bacterium]|nr:GAF domain-containing protein [Burkholderiales bacterium]